MTEQVNEWNKKRAPVLADDLDILLGDLCIIWGFCNGLTGWELTHAGASITAESFAKAVVAAESLDHATAEAWLPRLAEVFVARYGDAISAQDFARVAEI